MSNPAMSERLLSFSREVGARFRHFLKSFAVYATRRGGRARWSVLSTYVVVSIVDALGLNPRTVKVLGRRVEFPEPFGLRVLIEELMIGRHYAPWPPVRDAPLIIDAGANIGLATLYFKRLFPRAHVVCVEPHPQNARYLRANLSAPDLKDVEIVEAALTADSLPRRIVGDNIGASIVEAGDTSGVPVEAVTFDGLTLSETHVDILKMDIEGGELEVFRSIARDLAKIDQVLAEIHIGDAGPDPLPEILSILSSAGHRYELLHWHVGNGLATCVMRSWRREAGAPSAEPLFL